MADTIANFERDTQAGALLAARFGAGVGHAEHVIEANSLRFSDELIAANSLPKDEDASKEIDKAKVAELIGVSPKAVLDVAARGSFVTFVAEDSEGRVYKGALHNDDGDLSLPEAEAGNVARARLSAHAEAATKIAEAEREAERIKADAEAEAQKIIAEAAQKAEAESGKAQEKAQKVAQRRAEKSEGGGSQS